MAALSAKNAVFVTTLCTGIIGGYSISHDGLLVSRRAQVVSPDSNADSGKAFMMRHHDAQEGLSFVEMEKPIRIVRQGSMGAGGGTHETHQSKNQCGSTHKVDSSSDKWEVCPESCPFYAQDRTDDDFCTFSCVGEPSCAKMNPKTPIGDKKLGVCRSCVVDGCSECDLTSTVDRCVKCQAGYYLNAGDGLCYFKYGGAWTKYAGYAVLAVLAVVLVWVLDMAIRPTYNEVGLKHALDFREKCKLLQKKDEAGDRHPWPLTTNLLTTPVAGPGLMLHMNFQVALIFWAIFVACVWMFFAQFVDAALWVLGTRSFGTPRSNCILVFWGYETQQRLMWTKVAFLWIVYLGTFVASILYGIYQLRAFQAADYQHKTMKDYVVMITGLPDAKGTQPVEKDLKETLERVTGQKVVGVSVAWDYAEHKEQIEKVFSDELVEQERMYGGEQEEIPAPETNAVRNTFLGLEDTAFGLCEEEENKEEASKPTPSIVETMEGMSTSGRAFAVFETEDARDAAVKASGFEFEGAQGITIESILAEPDTVQWHNFGHGTVMDQVLKIIAGFGIITLACAVWAIVFYAPYAYYVMTFNYENGRSPGFAVGFAFSMIVCIGNVIMYEVCAQISDWVGFRFRDHREACYMILYTIACMFNVALDFVTTYATAEKVMEGLGFRTYFGVPLQDVEGFAAKFETYGMQRSLAGNTFDYAFPSTYLIPFLIEPVASITIPLLLGRWVIKGHVGVQGRAAEDWLAMAPMDMGRYADLLLNVILGILIFFFPGGFTWQLFLGMAGSHAYIYLFDQFKVLRSIPACMYASFDIEWWAQAMFAPITGIIVACIVFKANCEPGYHCTSGVPLGAMMWFGWAAHMVVHLLALNYIVPMFGKEQPEVDPCEGMTYREVAEATPSNWFNSNPMHCIRSKYKYKHNPPCSFMTLGKEKYMKANPAIGCFYEEVGGKK